MKRRVMAADRDDAAMRDRATRDDSEGVTGENPAPASSPSEQVAGGETPQTGTPPEPVPVYGYVDQLARPDVVRGWAGQPGNPQSLRIYVLGAEGLIGDGVTGEGREAPLGNSGFTVTLSQPISVADLRLRYVNVFAIGANGEQQLLRVWEHIAPPDPSAGPDAGAQQQNNPAQSAGHPSTLAPAEPERYDVDGDDGCWLYGFAEASASETAIGRPNGGTVVGCVDALNPPDVVRGWATRAGNPERFRIDVLGAGGLLGEGTTGDYREAPPGNCGFAVKLLRPISVADLLDGRVAVYAVDSDGERQFLPIWEHIIGPPPRSV